MTSTAATTTNSSDATGPVNSFTRTSTRSQARLASSSSLSASVNGGGVTPSASISWPATTGTNDITDIAPVRISGASATADPSARGITATITGAPTPSSNGRTTDPPPRRRRRFSVSSAALQRSGAESSEALPSAGMDSSGVVGAPTGIKRDMNSFSGLQNINGPVAANTGSSGGAGGVLSSSATSSTASSFSTTRPSRGNRSNTVSKSFHDEENESACCECEGGGDLICCDLCIRAFHVACVPEQYRPVLQDENSSDWSCPVCQYFGKHDTLEKRRGVLLLLRHPVPVPPNQCDPQVKRLRNRIQQEEAYLKGRESSWAATCPSGSAPVDYDAKSSSGDSHSLGRRILHRHEELYLRSHRHYLFDDESRRQCREAESTVCRGRASSNAASLPRSDDDSDAAPAAAPRTTRRQTAAASAATQRRADSAGLTSTAAPTNGLFGCRMNVGVSFQAPSLPLHFLQILQLGRQPTVVSSGGRLVYSRGEWSRLAQSRGLGTPFNEARGSSPQSSYCATGPAVAACPAGLETNFTHDAAAAAGSTPPADIISVDEIVFADTAVSNLNPGACSSSNGSSIGGGSEALTVAELVSRSTSNLPVINRRVDILLPSSCRPATPAPFTDCTAAVPEDHLKRSLTSSPTQPVLSSTTKTVSAAAATITTVKHLPTLILDARRDGLPFSHFDSAPTFVDTKAKLNKFCETLAFYWPVDYHWPYSSEYAYKLLQHYKFDSRRALACFFDSNFDFIEICDPPCRPYFNKWRPKDKRSTFPSTPFPPPQHLRAAFSSTASSRSGRPQV